MQQSEKYAGLVFIKHGRIGSKSEGPDYYLQAKSREYLLDRNREALFKPDYYLEFFCRKMVEVTGTLDKDTIQVISIREICDPLIPDDRK